MLVDQSSWTDFVNTQPPEAIAKRIRLDDELVNAGSPCSFTAYHLPKSSTPHALAIANHLVPVRQLSRETKRLVYESLVAKIKAHLLAGPQPAWRRADKRWVLRDGITWEPAAGPKDQGGDELEDQDLPTPEELSTTLRVLQRLTHTATLQLSDPISTAITTLQERLHTSPQTTAPPAPNPPTRTSALNTYTRSRPPHKHRLCYICRLTLTTHHPLYACLCPPCGSFNLANSALSLPPNLRLPARTALVTGARVNLGYHTALRLLRCGARVIASTRYPRDAVERYGAEVDRAEWWGRLRIAGADFRSAADAFGLVREVRRVLAEWGGEARLDILVNNAAQTLTDGVEREERAVGREDELRATSTGGSGLLVEGAYRPRVRGGAAELLDVGAGQGRIGSAETAAQVVAAAEKGTGAEIRAYSKSSWVQSLFEIPYEDVISAHAVNTFVPLILCRELLPLMGRTRASAGDDVGTKPLGYIINVSSREGIFESLPNHSFKRGQHVHTNISKAALNMLTETEAAEAWRSRRVAMNTVDPGYMSAAPEYEDAYGGVRPIGWEDGAGRVLWPVAMGEGEEAVAVWGRFLKHYGACDVDPGVGRG